MTSTEGVALQVDDVYVPLGLVERKKQSKPQDNISPEQGSELYKETEITKTYEHNAFLEEVLKQKNTPKSQGKRIAIIGEPGAGKTTLLQQIADWVSRKIPQSIVIWVSLADLQEKQKLEKYLFETWLSAAVKKKGKAKPTQQQDDDFVTLFNQNQVWLLLDGLDEMSASNPLTEIARQFRESGLISQARIVLTCRVNLWDGSSNALDDFDIYRTLDFSYPEQVEKFIHKWFAAIPDTGNQLCIALQEPGKERIQDLVKNPLRLTLLCFNWQSKDGKLPDTQAGLYQQFVDDFYKWKQDEFPITSHQEQQLNLKLGKLAKAAIDEKEIRFRLPQDFVNSVFKEQEDEMLLNLALNRGWLNCIGVDDKKVYAFFHASFQEYFAAKAINHWHFFLKHVPHDPSQRTYRIFEPQWKQTILLWLGRPEEDIKQQKQEFIDALVSFKDGCEKFYEYRAYFLAAAGIVEFRDYLKADKIIKQIVNWTINSRSSIQEEASSALQQTDRKKAIAALVQRLQSQRVDNYTRREVAESLGRIDPGNPDAIAALVQLLQSQDVDNDTRWRVTDSLEKIGTGNPDAIAALVQLLQSQDVDNNTRKWVAYILGTIDPGNPDAIAALVQLLQSQDVDNNTRKWVAESLGTIGKGNPDAISALVQLLQSQRVDNDTRRQVAYSLGTIDPGNPDAIAALVQPLQSQDVDNNTRKWVAYILGTIDPGNPDAIAALVQPLQSQDVDNDTRRQVAYILGKIGKGNSDAIAALVQLLQSQGVDNDTRRQVAYSLGKIGKGNPDAIAVLVQLLQSQGVDNGTRRQVADSLRTIDPGNPDAIAALVQLLQSQDVDNDTRSRVADSLGTIGTGNADAITALVQLLQSQDVDNYTRWQVASSLGRIGTGNPDAITALVQLLQSQDVDNYTRWQVADSLGRILQDNKHRFEVVKTLSGYWQLDYQYYNLAWKCAQNMPYPDFYQAWHQHNFATRTMRTLKKILFTRII
ncbi:HEAT repeat domain-containing protein [Nostoc sp. TCL26-01]|uniref:HEAT repeat domain-containing protein n=1 Tax=Nostoc sp. TCL26-01 TaxID=2576904 RepID=UPI0015BD01F7|nr:HEAT repeat domain-containing protein [Nostoc sp. TCL26-01]QLE57224.1 NACHT domain-containing protein [Nostoc sp. TCL26-01]